MKQKRQKTKGKGKLRVEKSKRDIARGKSIKGGRRVGRVGDGEAEIKRGGREGKGSLERAAYGTGNR